MPDATARHEGSVGYDPFDTAHLADHFPTLERLRAEEPVAEVGPGMFYLSRHADIVAVSLDPETFPQGGFEPLSEEARSFDRRALGETDAPAHTPVRRAMAAYFRPQVMREVEPAVGRICRELVAAVAGRARFDLVRAIAAPLPARVVAQVVGLDGALTDRLASYSDDFILSRAQPGTDLAAEAIARCDAFDDELRLLIRRRRADPSPPADLLTALVECEVGGEPISETKVLTHLTNDLIVGGIDTTAHLIGNLFVELLSDRRRYERVRADRSLMPVAVEETLRHLGPVQVVFRRASRDVVLRGVPIPAGSMLILGLSSGSRDEELCPHAQVYDLDRPGNARRHLGFNIGLHLCVGAPLARLEAVTILATVLDELPALALAEDFAYERVPFFLMRGATAIPVTNGAG